MEKKETGAWWKRLPLIWHSVIWSIWMVTNENISSNCEGVDSTSITINSLHNSVYRHIRWNCSRICVSELSLLPFSVRLRPCTMTKVIKQHLTSTFLIHNTPHHFLSFQFLFFQWFFHSTLYLTTFYFLFLFNFILLFL